MYTTARIQAPLLPSDVSEIVIGSGRISQSSNRTASMPGVWDYQQNHDSFITSSSQLPRHFPDPSDPWTQYSSIHDPSHEPSPADNLFGPGHSPTAEARCSSQWYLGVGYSQEGNSFDTHQNKNPSSATLESSLDNDDAIGEPPSSNPVEPSLGGFGGPAQVSAIAVRKLKRKGGRIGKLDPRAKEHAKSKRSAKDTCWHCRILRVPV